MLCLCLDVEVEVDGKVGNLGTGSAPPLGNVKADNLTEIVLGSRNESENAETGRKASAESTPVSALIRQDSGVQLKSPPRMPNSLYRA